MKNRTVLFNTKFNYYLIKDNIIIKCIFFKTDTQVLNTILQIYILVQQFINLLISLFVFDFLTVFNNFPKKIRILQNQCISFIIMQSLKIEALGCV